MKKYFLFVISACLGIASQAQNYRAMGPGKSYEDAKVYAAFQLFGEEIGDLVFKTSGQHGTTVSFAFQPVKVEGEGLCLRFVGSVLAENEEKITQRIERYQRLLVDENYNKSIQSMIEPLTFVKEGSSNAPEDGLKVIHTVSQTLSDGMLSEKIGCEFYGCLKWEGLKFSEDSTAVKDGNEYHFVTAEVSKTAMQKLLMSIMRSVNVKNYVCDEGWLLDAVRKK